MTSDERRPHALPPVVEVAQQDVDADPAAAEARGAAWMASSADAILAGVEAAAADYVARRAAEVIDAWGRVDAPDRESATTSLRAAAERATARVLAALRDLFALDPARQRRTPLEIVRTLPREPSEVLAALGVPPIVRDPFEERALPEDVYGLAPRTLADLGDAELGAMLLAWGVGKAMVVRARAAAARDEQTAPE